MSATPFGADVHAGTAAAGFRAGPKTPDTLALFVCPESRRVRRVPRSEASRDHPKDHIESHYEAPERSPFHAGLVHARYDLSGYNHPGGPVMLKLGEGRDATAMFEAHHPFTNRVFLEKLLQKHQML